MYFNRILLKLTQQYEVWVKSQHLNRKKVAFSSPLKVLSCKYESRNFPSKRSDCKRVVEDREVLQRPGLLGRVGTEPGLHKEVDLRVQVGKVLLHLQVGKEVLLQVRVGRQVLHLDQQAQL